MTARRGVWMVGVAMVLAAGGTPTADQRPAPARAPAAPTMKSEMRVKLTHAQALLAAVVRRDFAAIDRAAERLSRISEMEISSWQARPAPPEYAEQGVQLLTAVQALRDAARDRNIVRAGEAYTALTSSCVTCHRFGRDVGAAPR